MPGLRAAHAQLTCLHWPHGARGFTHVSSRRSTATAALLPRQQRQSSRPKPRPPPAAESATEASTATGAWHPTPGLSNGITQQRRVVYRPYCPRQTDMLQARELPIMFGLPSVIFRMIEQCIQPTPGRFVTCLVPIIPSGNLLHHQIRIWSTTERGRSRLSTPRMPAVRLRSRPVPNHRQAAVCTVSQAQQ